MITPPFCLTSLRISSGTLRGDGQMAKALEWLAIKGASETRRASAIVAGETCEISTSMPEPIHLLDDPFAEGGKAVVLGRVGGGVGPVEGRVVRQRHVTRARARRTRGAGPGCSRSPRPLRSRSSEAILPAPAIRSTSSAV